MSKLELYRSIKYSIEVEPYVTAIYLSRHQRRQIAMTRGGVLPIEIEKGRWRGRPREQRICRQCTMGQVEDISHFILQCPVNRHLRNMYIPNESLTDIMTNDTFLRNLTIFIIQEASRPDSSAV